MADSMDAAPALEFEGAGAVYGDGTVAVSGLDMSIARGEPVAIIGPSGCGKSTTLLMAAGLLRPSEGDVRVAGSPVAGVRRETALILQGLGLMPWKTVRANVELGLRFRHEPADTRRERAAEALFQVGLSGFADRYPGELSGGMRQRVAIARSLALDCDLLLMDEPLSALDAILREQVQDLLLGLQRRRGYAQVSVTHSSEEAAFLGRWVLVMAPGPGRVVAEVGNPGSGDRSFRGSEAFYAACARVRRALEGAVGRA